MADGTVKMEFTADEAKMVLAIKNVLRHQRRMTGEAKRTARETRRAAKAGRSFTSSLSTLSAITGGVVGIGFAWRVVGDEIQRAFDRMKSIADLTTTRAAEFLPAVSALPPQIAELGPEFLNNLIKQAQEVGPVSQTEILKGIQFLGSVAGTISPETFTETLKLATRLSALTAAEETPLFAGAIQKVASLAGLQENAAAAAGLLFQLGTATPIGTLTEQARNLPRALAQIAPQEPSIEAAGELLAALAQVTGDPTGRRAGTQAGAIASRIRTEGLFPTGRGRGRVGELEPLSVEERKDRSTLELLELVRGRLEKETAGIGEQERFIRFEQVISSISESVAGASFVRGVFQRDPRTLAEIEQARRAILPVETPRQIREAEEFFERRVSRVEKRPEVQALLARRELQAGTEQAVIAQPGVALRGIIFQQLDELQKILPQSTAFGERIQRLRALLDQDAEGAIERAIGLVQRFQEPERIVQPGRVVGLTAVPGRVIEKARDPELIAALETFIHGLERLEAVNKQQLETAQETETTLKRIAEGGNGRVTPLPTGGFDTEQ